MRKLLAQVFDYAKKIGETLKMIDWSGLILAILKSTQTTQPPIDPEHLVIKAKLFNDENWMRAVSGIRAALYLLPAPPATLAAAGLGLGQTGFSIWKRIVLSKEYSHLEFPPIGKNMLRVAITLDPELNKHYGHLTQEENWNEEAISQLEELYSTLNYVTEADLLEKKYPHLSTNYLKAKAALNKEVLQRELLGIENHAVSFAPTPEVEANVRQAFQSLREIFPLINSWSVIDSKVLSNVIDIIDIVI